MEVIGGSDPPDVDVVEGSGPPDVDVVGGSGPPDVDVVGCDDAVRSARRQPADQRGR